MKTRDQDHRIMSILNVTEISRVICDTNMGTLKLRIRKGETAYKFVLDAVELPKDLNSELMEAIYPLVTSVTPFTISNSLLHETPLVKIRCSSEKPKGRPRGSKNKVNDETK